MKKINLKIVGLIFSFQFLPFCLTTYAQIVGPIEVLQVSSLYNIFMECDSTKDVSFNGSDTNYYNKENEKIMVITEYKLGKKIKATGYYDNKQKYREAQFNGHVKDGIDVIYYKNGITEFFASYSNGEELFPFKDWFDNGKLKEYNDYDEKKNVGSILEWYPNGLLKRQVFAIDTCKKGHIELNYSEGGQIIFYNEFNIGKGVSRAFYKNGQLGREGHIFNLQLFKLGKWKEWYDNGKLKREYEFSEETPNLKVGIWKWYNEEGKISKTEDYRLKTPQMEE